MNSTQFGLQGIEDLSVKFGAIKYDLKFKGGRFALRKAATIVKKSAETSALSIDDPKTREVIAKNIVVRFSKNRFRSTGDLMMRVGVLGGARDTTKRIKRRRGQHSTLEELGEIAGKGKENPGGDTFYWRFPEFGTEKMAAHPFMRPALENNVSAATNEFVSQYKKSIDRSIKKSEKVNA